MAKVIWRQIKFMHAPPKELSVHAQYDYFRRTVDALAVLGKDRRRVALRERELSSTEITFAISRDHILIPVTIKWDELSSWKSPGQITQEPPGPLRLMLYAEEARADKEDRLQCVTAIEELYLHSPDGVTNGERCRIDGPEWVRLPHVLPESSNVEIPVRRAPERLAALTRTETEKSHADAEVRAVRRAMQVQDTDDYDGLKATIFEAFRVQNFSGRSNERTRASEGVSWDGWSSRQDPASPIQSRTLCGCHQSSRLAKRDRLLYGAIEVGAQEKPLAKAVTMLKELKSKRMLILKSNEQSAREVAEDLGELVLRLKELLTSDIPATVKRGPLQQRRRREKKDRRTCVNMRMNRPHQPRLSFFYPKWINSPRRSTRHDYCVFGIG
ncbi:hypothetical protein T11_15635 [Trichinella zimbabwensis]|uniref:Uncharacterized protein n=1 Tax=Trichinella zimbabwensis TaxID=268475 RepID=A0A0V1GV38_9BILA|nr:hypothetical protein T11_15635 [Trichinella zimbabwensis]